MQQFGLPEPRSRPHSFEAFLSALVGKQLSTKATQTIMARVQALMASMSSTSLLALSDDTLRTAGLSYRKIEYAKDLANVVVSGNFDIAELTQLDNKEAIREITQLRGFGRWSAEIYLIFTRTRRYITR